MGITLAVDATAPDRVTLDRAAAVLASGGLVGYPTDTLYGVAADPRHVDAVRRVFVAKGRGADRALPLVAADLDQVVATLGPLSGDERRLVAHAWPGPLALVVRTRAGLAPDVIVEGTVAVRVPAHAVARGLARALGHPVTATSANLAGHPAPRSADDIPPALRDALALVLDAGPSPGGPPSTIVRIDEGHPRLLREGAFPFARVLELLR